MSGLSRGADVSAEVNVIVGAGQAGAHAAMAMRAAGFAGRIVLLGEEAERPYERPPLSKEALLAEPEPPPAYFHAAEKYPANAIELRTGVRAEGIDATARRLFLGDGTTLPYDRLLLTTGGRARPLPVPGGAAVPTLRTLADARALRARMVPGARVVCIGAGVIGLETAASAHLRGAEVTVIEALPGVMGRCLTPPLAAWMERLHREAGVALHLSTAVEAVEPGRVLAGGQAFPADLVIAGIGMVRNTGLAEAAGATVENGIFVDALGRTDVEGIWAAGDVAAFWHARSGRRLRMESWRHAMNHGIATGRAMAGVQEPYDDVAWFWTDQHGRNVQVAGLLGDAVRSVVRGELAAPPASVFHLDAEGRVVAAEGIDASRDIRAAMAMIKGDVAPDPAALADPRTNLQALARGR
jgi:NADPH-dependent 2,4-dienoyl-CoA reductase/sulfur reductase-like enzyme